MFKRILVPLDGSPRAERAIFVTAHIARASSASIVLVRVVESPINYAPYVFLPAALPDEKHEKEEASRYLEQVAQSDDLKGIEVSTAVEAGPPAMRLLEVVEDYRADLVVLCSHGYSGFKRWVLGSVAEKIVRHTSVPVLVLR